MARIPACVMLGLLFPIDSGGVAMRRIAGVLVAFMAVMPLMGAAAQEETGPAEVLATDVIYIVVERDNLDGIGAFFDVRVGCIRETNSLAPGHILYPGDELLISAACPAYDGADVVINPRLNAPGRDGSDGTYVVRPEDTLDEIGQTLNISVQALKQSNNIVDGRTLEAGQIIVIPKDAPEYGVFPALDTSRTESAPEGSTFYVVQPQETVDGIGAKLNKDHYCILDANQITNTRMVIPGTALVIPDDCGPYAGFDVVPVQQQEQGQEEQEQEAQG